jgi:glycerol-3-phosphate O-acyltransferase
MRREDQERIVTEVQSRIVEQRSRGAAGGGQPLDEVLADSVYHERRRLKDDRSGAAKADGAFWHDVEKKLGKVGERELVSLLHKSVRRYAEEVCGNFDPRLYQIATRMLPSALGVLLNAVSPKRLVERLPKPPSIDEAVIIQGETEHLRRLHEVGTVILTPTHVSHLDSIILGYAIYKLGLPPFVYGAGLNLFSNPLMGFFLRNLGAYTVDRRKQDPLYKDVLKEYATLTLEYGYDNLFFPGGTRSRSGALERKLKLGLLGTSVNAYVNNLRRNAPRPKIFIVPATLSYQLVLEAETLMDDFLKEVGKSRYIITDDEASRPKRIYEFVDQMLSLDSRIYLTISRGCDPFGNEVDDDGESHDPRGRRVDPSRYVIADGEPRELPQRDAEYTREVGIRISDAFARDNVVQSTNILAHAIFTLLREQNRNADLVRLLRTSGATESLEMREVYRETRRVQSELTGLARRGGIRLAHHLESMEPEDLVADALRHFAIYHTRAAATRRGDRVFATDRTLLFYYQNRLEGYRLERNAGLEPALSSDHRTLRAA